MVVSMGKITAMVLHEAHERQVEEPMGIRSLTLVPRLRAADEAVHGLVDAQEPR